MNSNKSLEIATVLILGNLVVCVILLFLFFNLGKNEYINGYTVLLTLIFSFVNISMLKYNKRRKNPFIIILSFINLIYYTLRILTLIVIPYSSALNEYRPLRFEDINHTLFYIILANFAIFLGILFSQKKEPSKLNLYIRYDPQITKIIIIIINIIITLKTFDLYLPAAFYSILIMILDIFANLHLLMLLLLTYFILHFNKISKKHKILLGVTVLYFFFTMVIIGSRSTILVIIQFLLIIGLVIKENIKISLKMLILLLFLGCFSIIIFLSTSRVRQTSGYDTRTKVTTDRVAKFKNTELVDNNNLAASFQGLTSRMGALDYAVQLIANKKPYSQILNLKYYLESIVDNGITPGFNVFNTPRASHSFRYITERIKSNPTHQDVSEEYASSMFTIYGEFYVFFGKYFSLIIFFCTTFLFNRIYYKISQNKITSYFIKPIILLLFLNLIMSFGLDWFVIEAISFYLTFITVGIIFYKRVRLA